MVVAESFYTMYLISFVLQINIQMCVVCVFIFNLKSDQITVILAAGKDIVQKNLPSCVEC